MTIAQEQAGGRRITGRRPGTPPERVFVVQFYADTTLDTIHMSGRIEHVVSGQARHFHSLATLLDFITHVLAEGETVGKAET